MADKVRVAVIGVGFVGGQAHVPSIKKAEGSELVALAARTERHVKPLAEKYNTKYYLAYDELLEDPNIDAIVIALPTPMHFDITMKAIKNGKHVLCEMPIAATVNQAKLLAQTAQQANVLLMPVLQFRFAPIYTKTKEMLHAFQIGKPLAFTFREFIPAASLAEQWPIDSWAWNTEKSGGPPDYTLSVWSLDMFRWLFQTEIASVNWQSNYPTLKEYGNIIGYNTMGLIKLSNGTVGTLHYSASVTASTSTSKLEIYGDNTNVLHAIGYNKILLYNSKPEPQETTLDAKGTAVWGHRQIDQHFIDCILHGKQPQATVDDAIKAMEAAKGITENYKTQTRRS